MTAVAPSKHAKSTSARDMRYGRRGGRWLPLQSDYEQAEALAAAIESGVIVSAKCGCTEWLLIARDAGRPCKACGQPMGEQGEPKWIILDDDPMVPGRAPCPQTCPQCFGGHAEATGRWEYFAHAIGQCESCHEPCRSTNPEGRLCHPNPTCVGMA